jgi:hypothetical protein
LTHAEPTPFADERQKRNRFEEGYNAKEQGLRLKAPIKEETGKLDGRETERAKDQNFKPIDFCKDRTWSYKDFLRNAESTADFGGSTGKIHISAFRTIFTTSSFA